MAAGCSGHLRCRSSPETEIKHRVAAPSRERRRWRRASPFVFSKESNTFEPQSGPSRNQNQHRSNHKGHKGNTKVSKENLRGKTRFSRLVIQRSRSCTEKNLKAPRIFRTKDLEG